MTVDERFLADIATEMARRLDVAGAQVALFDGDRVIEAATGMANAETGARVGTDTLFQIGSTTKLFAAALTLGLVDEGLAGMDEPVVSYLPDLMLDDPEATRSVTLRRLHSMSAGMDNGPYADFGRGDDCVQRYVAALAGVPHMAPVGTMFGYSNASTIVAGRVAEVLTGRPWEDALRERMLVPAGLRATASLFDDLIYRRVAVGHTRADDTWTVTRPWSLPRSMAPAGSTLCATAGDLVRFGRIMLRDGLSEDGSRVISPEAVRTMRMPVIETPTRLLAQEWCMGAYQKRWGSATMFGHSGTNASGSSMLLWSPEHDLAIASIANVPRLGYPFAYAVFAEVLSEAAGLEPPAQPIPDPSIEIDTGRYVGRYSAHGIAYDITPADGGLAMTIHPETGAAETEPAASILRPLAIDRFLPEDVAVSGGRGWDVAFVGDRGDGRTAYFLNGVMAARCVQDV